MGRGRSRGRGGNARARGRGRGLERKPPHSRNIFSPSVTSLTITRRFDSPQSSTTLSEQTVPDDSHVKNMSAPKSESAGSPADDEAWHDDFGLETEVHLGLPGDYSDAEDEVPLHTSSSSNFEGSKGEGASHDETLVKGSGKVAHDDSITVSWIANYKIACASVFFEGRRCAWPRT